MHENASIFVRGPKCRFYTSNVSRTLALRLPFAMRNVLVWNQKMLISKKRKY